MALYFRWTRSERPAPAGGRAACGVMQLAQAQPCHVLCGAVGSLLSSKARSAVAGTACPVCLLTGVWCVCPCAGSIMFAAIRQFQSLGDCPKMDAASGYSGSYTSEVRFLSFVVRSALLRA